MSENCEKTRVGVLRHGGQFQLLATEAIAAGERIFRIEGERTSVPTRYSVQLDETTHIDLGERSLEEFLDRYFWRFMNHHCEPSTFLRGDEVYAARDIARGDDLTFNYNTTEYAMAEPFDCHCGSAHCQGTVRGFRWLPAAEQEALRPWLAPYLLRLLDSA
jgi:SET domain